MPSSNQPARSLNFERLTTSQANLKPITQQQPQIISQSQQQQQSTLNLNSQTNPATSPFPITPNISLPVAVPANQTPSSHLTSVGGPPTGPNDASRMFPSAFPTATPSPNHRPATSNVINHPPSNAPSTIDVANSVSYTVKKRLKLIGGASESTLVDSTAEEHCVALRKRILDHKYSRLKHVKDKYELRSIYFAICHTNLIIIFYFQAFRSCT